MATLPRELRSTLERVVLAARRQAESGARKALEQLAVAHHEPWPTMTSEQQKLRRRLRARGRQLGDRLEDVGTQSVDHLVSECAYEQWHRMLFARFLAECGLLIEPVSGVPVSIGECKVLARERSLDWISLASTFAQDMLPQIFRTDDAVLEMSLPAEHRQPLEQLLVSLPSEVFLADDSLGWVYQFWQSDAKDAVNKSEARIGADQLPAVTQLFTEDYIVDFLLDNTLGAWHAGKVLAAKPTLVEQAHSEEELRNAIAFPGCPWRYLRFIKDDSDRWTPAAGTFDGWPRTAKELKCVDPCMGSGHFVVAMFGRLVALRMAEEELDETATVAAVIGDNLFGLEIDSRCTQIGAFNLALAAWRRVGHCALPPMNLACSGFAPNTREADWLTLADHNENLQNGMERLHRLFKDAPVLGSLINPRDAEGDLLEAAFHELQPLLEKALAHETGDDTAHEMAVTARGLAKAAEILASRFTLVATNVPYLGRGKQGELLQEYCARVHPAAKADLATCFVERCLDFCASGGSAALVTPQNWLFLGTYRKLRLSVLKTHQWDAVAKLGPRAFETIGGEVVNVALVSITKSEASERHSFLDLDVSEGKGPHIKAALLLSCPAKFLSQAGQLSNPDHRVGFTSAEGKTLLFDLVDSYEGIGTGDLARFQMNWWEALLDEKGLVPFRSTTDVTMCASGCTGGLVWENGLGELILNAKEQNSRPTRGFRAWGKKGVAINRMGSLPASLYLGEKFDCNIAAIIPKKVEHLAAIWCFCSDGGYSRSVREIDKALKVTNHTLVKVPFDLVHWQRVASERYPNGLPKPFSSDPTQWLFNGHPKHADHPLHVAVARLLGYQWPRQTGSSFPDCPALEPDGLESFGAEDGIVCISSVKGEEAAGERLIALLSRAYGSEWGAAKLEELLRDVGYAGETVEAWLRDGFFEQHCEIFHQRPFLWHVWDGRKDGFSVLVNFHRLTKANLERLTYAYLGDWIRRQEASIETSEAGSDARLVAAKQLQHELKSILEGEPPYDIFVRWKQLARQPIGWEPDRNDGVRINIRPFLMSADLGKKGAGLLRVKPSVKWDKDRGSEPSRSKEEFPWFWGWDGTTTDFAGGSTFDGNRWNELHYSREFKMAARHKRGLP